ncbi:Imm50 family immunity protein [Streptomyces sp. NPDC047841]|uniref:Imm50 family immunity protein n=1 Tax=Streptomyces sp. NPDC047841 TaxID=3154708 RepID=UPI003452D314
MSWTSFLHSSQGIDAIYQGRSAPDLIGVQVREVVLHQNGPTLKLRLDLPRYPEQPPKKWNAQGFNTVQIEISFSGLRSLTLEGFGTDVIADVSLHEEGGVILDVSSSTMQLSAIAEVAFISKLTAYTNGV